MTSHSRDYLPEPMDATSDSGGRQAPVQPRRAGGGHSWEAVQLVSDRRGPRYGIDVSRSRFPYCIVWTPLPGITALFPFIGHMGIADSRGVIYDFAGPYSIGVDDMAFGKPVRYLQVRGDVISSCRQQMKRHRCPRRRLDSTAHIASLLLLTSSPLQLDPELITRKGRPGMTAQEAWDDAVDGGADVSCRPRKRQN